jgi:hypothetical protein
MVAQPMNGLIIFFFLFKKKKITKSDLQRCSTGVTEAGIKKAMSY